MHTKYSLIPNFLNLEFSKKIKSQQHQGTSLCFHFHFTNLGFSDTYAVNLWQIKDFIRFGLSKSYKGFYFYQRFKHNDYIVLNNITNSL